MAVWNLYENSSVLPFGTLTRPFIDWYDYNSLLQSLSCKDSATVETVVLLFLASRHKVQDERALSTHT